MQLQDLLQSIYCHQIRIKWQSCKLYQLFIYTKIHTDDHRQHSVIAIYMVTNDKHVSHKAFFRHHYLLSQSNKMIIRSFVL